MGLIRRREISWSKGSKGAISGANTATMNTVRTTAEPTRNPGWERARRRINS
jgi:hypothetical protein